MDDTEDDARYPPIPHPSNPRRPFSTSSYRPPAPSPPPIHQNYPDDDEDDEENNTDHAIDDDDDDDDAYAGGYRRIREPDDDSSSDSRGKRRRLDKYALGFEFAPRAAAKPVPPRNSPADWSEDATFVLLDTWGDLYVQNGRKSLRSDEWGEVAKKVNQASRMPRSDSQCRNRLDTLKKKYKKEKARMVDGGKFNSQWVYFEKMDALMCSPSPPPPPPPVRAHKEQPARLPCGVDAGEYVFTSSSVYLNCSNGMDEMRDSPGDTGTDDDDYDDDDDDDESDGPPPRRGNLAASSDASFRMLAGSIQKFGEIYEKIENSKRQQMAELERMRKEFHRDLEVHKRQILERAHNEIAKLRQEEGAEEEDEEERSEEDEDDGDGIDVSN